MSIRLPFAGICSSSIHRNLEEKIVSKVSKAIRYDSQFICLLIIQIQTNECCKNFPLYIFFFLISCGLEARTSQYGTWLEAFRNCFSFFFLKIQSLELDGICTFLFIWFTLFFMYYIPWYIMLILSWSAIYNNHRPRSTA